MPVYSVRPGFGFSLPRAVKKLLIINVVIFVITTLMGPIGDLLISLFGLRPILINHRFMIWQFFTYMFLHGSMGHIFFNMFALWMFGTELEYNWGPSDFLKYYFTCGIGGGLLVWFTAFFGFSSMYASTIGASGAVFGLLVAFGMMWPNRLIYIWGVFPIKALHLVLLFGAIDLLQGLGRTGGGIAYFAHVGGGVTGFIYLKYGWRVMIHLESFIKRFKRRKFTVIQGGASKRSRQNDFENDDASHPDLDDEVDRILDKIAREGMDSLSSRERSILDRASNRKRK